MTRLAAPPSRGSWLHVLDDKPVIHRADCISHPKRQVRANAPAGDDLAATLRDDIIAYGLAVRPAYESLSSLLGQYAGLLLLAYGSPRAGYPDLEVMALAASQLSETRDRLGLIEPPAGVTDHHRSLMQAASLLDEAHKGIVNGLHRTERKERAHRHLKAAQALLHRASDSRFAMTMVDFKNGCCCGTAHP